jgi:HK97 family phage prohead protease
MAFNIVDIDGTLALDNNAANKPLIQYLNAEVMEGGTQVIVVSARPIERLEETRAWLQENGVAGIEHVYLNDFEGAGQGPEVGLAFKRAKYEALITEYGIMSEATPNGIAYVVDNDPEVIAMAKELGLEAYAPEYLIANEQRAPVSGADKFTTQKEAQDRAEQIGCEGTHTIDENGQTIYMPCATHAAYDALVNVDGPGYRAPEHLQYAEHGSSADSRAMVAVPNYISAAATAGLEAYQGGLGGDGLQPATVSEARQLAAGEVSDEKAQRMGPWVARHRGDWEGVPQNSDPKHADWPGPGAVAALLWGVNPVATNGADRVIAWADKIKAEALQKENNAMAREQETRALPLGEFRLSDDGTQKVFSGYAALFGTPSAGLPFTETITPGAFKRTLGRVAQAERVVKFLHGHDESRMLASTASGRLTLTEDSQGLRVEAKLDPADPDAAAIISKLTHEAKAMGMSFGFTVPKGGDAWEGENRTLREVNLFEVSILSGHQPAYPATLGLSAVRKVAEPRIGVAAERLISTLEAVKAGKSLSPDEVEVIDAVRLALAPKSADIEPSIARARLWLAELQGEDI